LVRINTDNEFIGFAVCAAPVLLNRVERAQAGISRRRKNYVSTFVDLIERQFLAFARIVPRRVGYADVIVNYFYVGINGARTFFLAGFKTVNQRNIHTADKA
jgi:hypothetical protein